MTSPAADDDNDVIDDVIPLEYVRNMRESTTCTYATSMYVKLPSLSVCVSVFRISQKGADRFPRNFSWFIEVIGRREWIKNQENVDP